HFGSADKPAPVIEVSGRLFPVDVRYRAVEGDDSDDEEPLEEAIVSCIEELWREGPGDILAFLPGEREIRETGELARRSLARPLYTDPEVLRSSLASVILRMASLGLTAPEEFPFVDPPSSRAIADGYQLLQELDAVDATRALTRSGSELAKLPLDPRIGRILQAARERDCVAEALVIASALAVPDPRERPLERAQAADQAHLKFRDERSDFLSLIVLWQFFSDALAEKLSHRKLVDRCRAEFVSYLRLREWRDVHEQVANEPTDAGWQWNARLPATIDARRYAAIHQALLAGLLSNIGTKADDGSYD